MIKNTHLQIIKYLLAGGIAVAVNLSTLYSLTEFLHIYYLVSAVIAFCISFICSFTLQKFWTFRDHSVDRAGSQLSKYLLMQIINVTLNTTLLYILVEYAHIWYIFSQTIISLMLAVGTFFISRRYIFTSTPHSTSSF